MPPSRRALFVLAALALGAVPAALAQIAPPERPALSTLRRDARARLATSDAALAPPTVRRGTLRVEPVADGRVLVRADYRIRAAPPALAATPEAAARAYLVANAERYGLAAGLADLRTARVVSGAYDHHVTFQQTAGGFYVYGREIKVSLSKTLAPVMVVSGYAPGVRGRAVPAATLTAADALSRVRSDVLAAEADVTAPERVVWADAARGPRPAWRLVARTRSVAAEWEIVLDAATGEALAVFERTIHASFGAADAPRAAPAFSLVPDAPLAGPRALLATDAAGLVFDPDPLTTAGVGYGGAYVDANDADVPELNAQRREVVLREVGRENGKYVLKGPYVEIVGSGPGGAGSLPYTPPAEDAPAFRYTRADDRFEAVMAYYHIDKSQRRVQSLALGRPIHARPVRVNPLGLAADQSQYATGAGTIVFGAGGVDDAEDAGVILHEYAHALLHDQEPGVFISTEGQALHEGWADYWAASYTRGVLERGAGAGDPKRLFPWDGNAGCWQGRRLDHAGRYDPPTVPGRPNMRYPAAPGCGAMGTIYQWGLLWATTLHEIRDALGHDVTDRLALGSLAYLGPATSGAPAFEVAAEALLAADEALYGGSHRGALVTRLAARGYVDAGGYGPALAHEPLGSTEQAGGARRVEVAATGDSPVARVAVVYRIGEGAPQTHALTDGGDGRWAGEIPLPAGAGVVRYHVEATDEAGRTTRLPETTSEAYRFAFGPDTTPPALAHAPAGSLPRAAFPPEIVADASDDMGIDAVTVAFRLVRAGAAGPERVAGMRFESGAYRVRLPLASADVAEGDELRYTITARDRSVARNAATLPAGGAFALRVVGQGVLAAFDAERDAPGVTLTGAWRRGAPTHGLRAAIAGTSVFSTALAEAYPAEKGVSHLTLPPLDLRGGAARLVFWQWHDTERGPSTGPNACRSVCDGGRVEASVDGGTSWNVLVPEGGYPDTLDARFNGLPGGGAWGGYSFGWARVAVPLPAGPNVRVRFAFGTDAGNVFPTAHGYAGWAVDSLVVTTAPFAPDTAAPVALALPEARVLRGATEPAQAVTVRLDDETGVRRASLRYALVRDGRTVEADSARMAQNVSDLTAFAATPVLRAAPRAGDVLRYTVRADDFAGNARVFPDGAFEVAFRTLSEAPALVARPNGLWRRLPDGAHAASGDGRGGDGPSGAASSLVLVPLDLPSNADALRLVVRHRYRFGAGAGGNAKLSADEGRTWTLLVPDGGYPARLDAPGHPMHGEPVFAGADTLAAAFSLSAHAGHQVRVRFDVGAARPLAFGEAWTIEAATRYAATPDDGFETPRAPGLALAYPNPFRDRATVTYTLDAAADVTLEAYDVLGRRVAVLVGGARQEPGTYAATLDGSALAPGVYVLRLRAGGRVLTRGVVRG